MDSDWEAEQKAKLENEREELDKKMTALEKNLAALVIEEKQLKALMGHEKYPEWLELKKKRDRALKEAERLDAEMKRVI
jgi:hypothetical protein